MSESHAVLIAEIVDLKRALAESEGHLNEAGEHLGIPAGASQVGGCRAIAHQAKAVVANMTAAQDALAQVTRERDEARTERDEFEGKLKSAEQAWFMSRESLKADLAKAQNGHAYPSIHEAKCGHNASWTGVYGTCMVCRAEAAEQSLAQVEQLTRERDEALEFRREVQNALSKSDRALSEALSKLRAFEESRGLTPYIEELVALREAFESADMVCQLISRELIKPGCEHGSDEPHGVICAISVHLTNWQDRKEKIKRAT